MNTAGQGERDEPLMDASTVVSQVVHRPRRPLPALVVSLMAGMIPGALGVVDLSPPWILGLAFLCAGAGVLWTRRVGSSLCMHAAAALTGLLWMQIETGVTGPHDLRRHLTRAREFINVTGLIVTAPVLEESKPDGDKIWRFDLATESLTRAAEEKEARGRLRVRFRQAPDVDVPVSLGDRWMLSGAYRAPEPGDLRNAGQAGYLSVNDSMCRRIATKAGSRFVMWTHSLRERASEKLGWGLPAGASSVAFTRALLLGERSEVDRRVQNAFAQTGTLHILALSGMHVSIIVMLIVIFLKAAGISRPHWIFFFAPFLIIYTVGTGASASTVRAAIMAMVFFSSAFFRTRTDLPTSLAMSALLILLFDPFQLFNYGFILTFVVVAGLLLLHKPISGLFRREVRDEDLGPDAETSWWTGPRGLWPRIVDLFVISLAAWIISLPLMAGAFNIISPAALLVNIPLVPLSFVIMMTSCMSLLFSFAGPLTVIFNQANWFFCELMIASVDLTARVPGAFFYLQSWSWLLVVGWFVLVMLWVVTGKRVRTVVAALLMGVVVYSAVQRHFSRDVEAVIIPAGDASVLLIDGPGDRAMLIDAGESYRSRAVVEAVRSRGIGRLDAVWLTRATSDAYGGLTPLLTDVPVTGVYIPNAPSGQHHFHRQREQWLSAPGLSVQYWPATNDYFEIGHEVIVRIMYPPPGALYAGAKQSSMMLHISRGHSSMLWMGQAGPEIEALASASPFDWRAGVLATGFINTPDAFTDAWVDRVGPQKIMFGVRAFDRMRQGAGPLLRRLASRDDMQVVVMDEREPVVIQL